MFTDTDLKRFIGDGFLDTGVHLEAAYHESIRKQMFDLLADEPNPGNNLLPRLPDLIELFRAPGVIAALTGILGPSYRLEDHRYAHVNQPGSEPQSIHKDGGKREDHRARRVLLFYYPQDTPAEHGPTGVLPGSQYFASFPEHIDEQLVVGPEGTVVIAHYELWHRATANQLQQPRLMMKFLLSRTEEPRAPTWQGSSDHWDTENPVWQSIWDWHRGEAVHGGAGTGGAADDCGELLGQLTAEDEPVRLAAAYRLRRCADAPQVAASVVDLLADASDEVGRTAMHALAAIGAPAVPALVGALGGDDARVRRYAVHALAEMGRAAVAAEPALREALADPDMDVRRLAAYGLGCVEGPDVAVTMNALVPLLDDMEHTVSNGAGEALTRLAHRLPTEQPGLVAALVAALGSDRNRYARGYAADTLRRIGTPDAQAALVDWLTVARWCPLTTADSPF